ncbi:hypothetical protein J0A68_13740 [Algoriphagus sp. H41]|uniref:Uncharacterized protein n=1 Tax=Algoriphagus oliviformis TaxID=2811231 RepID=A0ABS3C618_9BACT|nr:hypothetical protein [Algoriphagus oliviformis]MBN7812009.1 hypothetical protein [Algoriphagus oliviformis]
MKIYFFVFAVAICFMGCQSDTDPTCLEVAMIGVDPCGGGMLVSVKKPENIGETITYDGTTYTNVVKVFTTLTIPASTTTYIQFRDFDPEKDKQFYGICLAIYAPYPVPWKVATYWTEAPC